MERLGVAMDLGTSGIRAQAVDLDSGAIVSTCISLAHPLPGANLMDHLHFVLELGMPAATGIVLAAINKILAGLCVPPQTIRRLAVCGNPVQISLFQGLEVRDLAYTGTRKLRQMGIASPDRMGTILPAGEVKGLALPATCEVVIPPAVSHAVGADGLAMILQSGIGQRQGTALITDYGTNAEMALCHEGRIITASAAAGPALEGRQISCGMLAGPGAVTDVQQLPDSSYVTVVLDDGMLPVKGPRVDLERPSAVARGQTAIRGITGTGVVAVLCEAMKAGHVRLPHILTPDGLLHLGPEIYLDESDLKEVGKAVGAIRAGHMALCHEAGIGYQDVQTVYMAGAAGTYVDAVKAQWLGLLPSRAASVTQVGNTSLKMARSLVMDADMFEKMRRMAARLRRDHCMLASSAIFKKIYLLELAYWTEGMPMHSYRSLLSRYGLKDLPVQFSNPLVRRAMQCDMDVLGRLGLRVIEEIGQRSCRPVAACTACGICIGACPQSALELMSEADLPVIRLIHSRCAGVSCKQCERACPEKVMILADFFSTCVARWRHGDTRSSHS